MNSNLEGPFVSAFENDTKGVVKQHLITYRIKDGMFQKETTTRQFSSNGDYYDSNTVEPMVKQEDFNA
tara:strand:- start:1083 stop:1286 length:204 start_codon:yes stop_codon:yes gene_type:complete